MIPRAVYSECSEARIENFCRRPGGDFTDILPSVDAIIESVRSEGDAALRRLTRTFDHADIDVPGVPAADLDSAGDRISPAVRRAIDAAAGSIRKFHAAQMPRTVNAETAPGVSCRLEWRPIDAVGLYIPGGSAPLVSTVLMLGVPARIAGCREIVLCTPPRPDGSVAPEILYAAASQGIRSVFRVGGAQAIAALAFGTTLVPKVDKIFGPGNRFVTAAKIRVSQPPVGRAIDLPAGPSELLVIADDSAPPSWIAADLLSQAEHGPDSQVVLVALSTAVADAVEEEIKRQVGGLPRQNTVVRALAQSIILIAPDLASAVGFSNRYAPEHLQIAVRDPERIASLISNAGSVFVGSPASVVFGDYASGTNHTLPTGGSAAVMGGVTVASFLKTISFQSVSFPEDSSLISTVESLARAEGLDAHAHAAAIRRRTQ